MPDDERLYETEMKMGKASHWDWDVGVERKGIDVQCWSGFMEGGGVLGQKATLSD